MTTRFGLAYRHHNLGAAALEQRQFTEAEACYRKSLEVLLETNDIQGIAKAYHCLGLVAREQGQFPEAETNYQKALDIRRESEPVAAAQSAMGLGLTYAAHGQHHQAIQNLMYAAVSSYQVTGAWAADVLVYLYRESVQIEAAKLAALIEANVPAELAADFPEIISLGSSIEIDNR